MCHYYAIRCSFSSVLCLTFAFGIDVSEICIVVVCVERVEALSFQTCGIFAIMTIHNVVDRNSQVFPLLVNPILTLLLVSLGKEDVPQDVYIPNLGTGDVPLDRFHV